MIETTVIDWDGTNVPEELSMLPPGRYFLSPYADDSELSEEEEAGILEALDDVDAGRVIPLEEVMRELRSRYPLN